MALTLALLLAAARGASAKTVKATTDTVDTRACQGTFAALPFCDVTKSRSDRIASLISSLKDDEIVPQLTARHQGGGNPPPLANVSRLGVPDWDWGLNCLHGVQSSCVQLESGDVVCPTSFPNSVNFGMTWNKSQAYAMGAIIATEVRALWLLGATEFDPWSGLPHLGLDCWSPTINLAREPRWGRNQESPGESPLLNGDYGAAHTRGLQEGEDSSYMKVAVTLKHWTAYSLEDSDGFERHNFNAVVSNYSLAATYLPAFKKAVVEGKAAGVMCSYNALNGVPTCASPFLRGVLRDTWGFDGYVTSDTGAVEDIWREHKYRNMTGEQASCAAIRDGQTDVCSGTTYHDYLLSAVGKGECSRDDVNTALQHTFDVRFRLGLFDGDSSPYWHVPPSSIQTPAAQATAWLATLEGLVLLKNEGGTLPLRAGKKLAVIGPHANATSALVGSYLGQLCPLPVGQSDNLDCIVSPFAALSALNAGGTTAMAPGCGVTSNDTSGFADAVALAAASDGVVLMMGIDESVEGESHDRTSIDLPGVQHALVAAVAAAAKGKPVVLVLLNGGSVDVAPERDAAGVGAILEAGYPGQRGGAAIAATLFGQNDHLGGKLPYTVYPAEYTSQIAMTEMELDVGPGRTFRYLSPSYPVVYPFGHGLSLTTMTLATVSAPTPAQSVLPTGPAGANLTYSVRVSNSGPVPGDEVVQVYSVPGALPSQPDSKLVKELIAYQRVHLQAGQDATVSFTLNAASFAVASKANGDIVSTPGAFTVRITNGVDQRLEFPLTLQGGEVVLEPFPRF